MNVAGTTENKYLCRINQSENRILEILSSPKTQSNRNLGFFMKNSEDLTFYKQYIKRKISKLFIKIDSKNSKPSLPHLETLQSDNPGKIIPIAELPSSQNLSKELQSPSLSHKLRSHKSLSPSSKNLRSRINLTPLNKNKCMKDYYFQIVKPLNNSHMKKVSKYE